VRSDIERTVDALTQSVTIEAVAAAIKTDDATVSEIISARNVAELPLNGRDPLKLATVTAGTIRGLKASNGTPPGEDFIGAGTREIQNSISLDGISIMNNLITKHYGQRGLIRRSFRPTGLKGDDGKQNQLATEHRPSEPCGAASAAGQERARRQKTEISFTISAANLAVSTEAGCPAR
jgi:hypothetical protein